MVAVSNHIWVKGSSTVFVGSCVLIGILCVGCARSMATINIPNIITLLYVSSSIAV